MITPERRDRILEAVDQLSESLVAFAVDLVRIPSVNPPGSHYAECATRIATEMEALGFEVEQIRATGRPEDTEEYPRPNVIGTLGDPTARPCVHFNGHFDVVPPGEGWTHDPFSGLIENGRLYGRGSADMKAGFAAALYAAAALNQAEGVDRGRIEVSGTSDEESGGFAGVGHLADIGRIAADRTDHVIIPEPFGIDRICVGHRGVYWFKVTALGRTGHGSMPFLGRSAIDDLTVLLEAVRTDLSAAIATQSTTMPVVPEPARRGSVNVNSVIGGQASVEPAASGLQTPCVADRAEAVFDRRFLPEEDFSTVRAEVVTLLERLEAEDPQRRYELEDLMVVHPTRTPEDSPVTSALESAVTSVVGNAATRVASPGTYDHKHVARIAGVEDCVAYGPGALEQAHQPDEYCEVEAIVTSAKVMALAAAELLSR
jgi:succinyl-diaminopimelate desuccinylase